MFNIQRLTSMLLCAIALASCSPKVDTRGYTSDENIKDVLVIGKTTRDEVQAKFGSPSSQSSFGSETWYYISGRKETVGPFAPEVVQQKVVRVEFDQAGIVQKVEDYSEKDGRDFALVKRTTPTEGHTMGFIEQALGNIGRFNRPDSSGGVAPGRRPGGAGMP